MKKFLLSLATAFSFVLFLGSCTNEEDINNNGCLLYTSHSHHLQRNDLIICVSGLSNLTHMQQSKKGSIYGKNYNKQ